MKSFCPLHVRSLIPKFLSVISAVLLSANAFAWGPHGEIAQAALDAVGPDDPLVRQLGPDAKRLAQYVWMADLRQTLLVRSDEVFYADDYLLFRAASRHYQHICPEVKQTYAPYFRRALQALRMESTRNAARWIGSLLHFTTDTGSPPHAAGFLGSAHSKMENWVDAKLIHIPGYEPRLLGADDVSAEAGFLQRMDGLIEFSKERAQRCRADVDADRRAAVEPVVLESALETARVTADLLHTLGVLSANATDDATLAGKVIVPKIEHATMSRLTAKVVLLGTSYSTLTEPDGTFTFRHLPAGEYRLVLFAPGRVSEQKPVRITAAASVTLEPVDLSQGADGNLVRNCTFAVRWVSAEAFDHWSLRSPPGKLAAKTSVRDWDGEWIPLQGGVTYHLTARWKGTSADADGPQVFLRTKAKPDGGSITTDSAPVIPGTKEVAVVGSPEAAWAQVCIRTSKSPDTVLEAVSLRQAP
jgi:Carboxypeptidase regulatory-like domain